MIGKVVKRVLRAAVAQPWEYVGEGAPAGPEFRVSPDGRHFASFLPERGTWMVHDGASGSVVGEVARLDRFDRETEDWSRFLEEIDPDE